MRGIGAGEWVIERCTVTGGSGTIWDYADVPEHSFHGSEFCLEPLHILRYFISFPNGLVPFPLKCGRRSSGVVVCFSN